MAHKTFHKSHLYLHFCGYVIDRVLFYLNFMNPGEEKNRSASLKITTIPHLEDINEDDILKDGHEAIRNRIQSFLFINSMKDRKLEKQSDTEKSSGTLEGINYGVFKFITPKIQHKASSSSEDSVEKDVEKLNIDKNNEEAKTEIPQNVKGANPKEGDTVSVMSKAEHVKHWLIEKLSKHHIKDRRHSSESNISLESRYGHKESHTIGRGSYSKVRLVRK